MKQYWGLVSAIMLAVMAGNLQAQEVEWDFTVEAERVEQSFEDGDSTIDTFTLAPALHVGDWSFSLSAPWQQVDGSYFVNNAYPNLEYVCSQINSLTALQKWLLYQNGTLTPQQIQYCNQTGGVESVTLQDSVDGWNDIEIFASYFLPLFSDVFSAAVGLGYKHDNGDAEAGLGTGTRDLFAEANGWWHLGKVVIGLTLGYEHLLENSTSIALEDYGYTSLDARWQLHELVAPGVEYHYQQANADVLDDLDYFTYYVRVGRSSGLGARLFITDYRDATGYPEEEFGGSLSYSF